MSSIKDRDWSEVVGESLRDVEMPVDDAIWGRVEGSLGAQSVVRGGALVWGLVSSIVAAASLIVLFWSPAEEIEIVDQPQQLVAAITPSTLTTPIVESREVAKVTKTAEVTNYPVAEIEASEIIDMTKESPKDIDKSKKRSKREARREVEVENRSTHYNKISIPKESRKTSIAVLYSGGISSNSLSASSTPGYMAVNEAFSSYGSTRMSFEELYEGSDISHRQPFGLGLRVQHELSRRLLLGGGVNYTRLVSDLTMRGEKDMVKQQIHLLGIPLLLKYRFVAGENFSLYLGTGGTVEYCLGAKVGDRDIEEQKWHYSADLNIGAEYNINEWFGLYLEPGVSHYFTQTTLKSIRNNAPTTFNLRLGLSFTL